MTEEKSYQIEGKSLTFASSGATIDFDCPVAEVLPYGDVYVVRIEPEPGHIMNENVFGIHRNGRILWRIEKKKHVYDDSPYMGIYRHGETVHAGNLDGDVLVIDPGTGRIIEVKFTK